MRPRHSVGQSLCMHRVVVSLIVGILSDYVQYSILILRLGLEYTFVKSYTNTLVISNIVFSMQQQ